MTKCYKVKLKRESTITEIPTASKLFGFIFGSFIREYNLNPEEIECLLKEIDSNTFQISDVFPKGMIYNPSINYFLNDIEEDFSDEKSVLQKKYKKKTYIDKEYLKERTIVKDGKLYFQLEEELPSDKFKKYESEIEQHVEINTSSHMKNGKLKPNPFNTSRLIIEDEEFEFYIEVSDIFDEKVKRVLKKDKFIILGAGSGKGKNMYCISEVEEINILKDNGMKIILSNYIPKEHSELVGNENANDIKLKNMSVRPVKKIDQSNDYRYRYFYIDTGCVINVNKKEYGYGTLLDYKEYKKEENYRPKIFGKAFLYPIEGE